MPKFKILRGSHWCYHPTKRRYDGKRLLVKHAVGEVFEHTADVTLLNPANEQLQKKYEKVPENVLTKFEREAEDGEESQTQQFNDGLEQLELAELKKLAKDEDISLGKLKTKDKIIERIRTTYTT